MPVSSFEYPSVNSIRAYPLSAKGSRASTDSFFQIPDSLILDATISYTNTVTGGLHVSKVLKTGSEISIQISNQTLAFVGTFNISVNNHQAPKVYFLQPSAQFTGANGKILVGELGDTLLQPSGTFLFSPDSALLEPVTIVPSTSGIDRITFENINGVSRTYSGNVLVIGRANIAFNYEDQKVFFDAANGLGLNVNCDQSAPPIRTINGVGPDSEGNFLFTGTDCAQFTAITNGLLLADSCCVPCEGCGELEELTRRVNAVEHNLGTLTGQYQELNRIYDNFKTTVDFSCDCDE